MTTPTIDPDMIAHRLRALFEAQTRAITVDAPPPVAELTATDVVRVRRTSPAHRSPRSLAIAATIVLFLGAGGAWWALGHRGESVVSDVPVAPTTPPLLMLDAPEWTMQYFAQIDPSSFEAGIGEGDDGRSTTFQTSRGADGPRVVVSLANQGTNTPDADEQHVTVGGSEASMYVDGDESLVRWYEPGGNRLEAHAWHVDPDDLVAFAGMVGVDDGGFPAVAPLAGASLPLGLTALVDDEAVLNNTSVTYGWTDSLGRELEINLYPGGRTTYDQRIDSCCDEGRSRQQVDYHGDRALVDRDEYMYRLYQQRGFWVWEISGSVVIDVADAQNFATVDDFLAAAELIAVTTDVEAWRDSLVDDVVLRDELPDVVAEMSVFPMPAGTAAPAVPDGGPTMSRAGIAQDIAVQMACAWDGALIGAVAEGDPALAREAIEAIRQVAAWDVVADVPDVYPSSEVPTPLGRIRSAAEVLAPWSSVDDAAVLAEIPIDAVDASIGCVTLGDEALDPG